MHHKRFSFQNEYRQFLLSYGMRRMCLRIKAFALTGRGDSTMRKPQGVASLALGYVHHWAFVDIIGCGSAIQASLIAFALHDDSARPC